MSHKVLLKAPSSPMFVRMLSLFMCTLELIMCVPSPIDCVQAHCYYVVLKAFHEAVDSSELSPSSHHILKHLCAMFAVFGIVSCPGDFTAVSRALNRMHIH